jgi:hypothetical protein
MDADMTDARFCSLFSSSAYGFVLYSDHNFPGKTEVEVSNGAFSIHNYGNSTKMKFALTAAKGLLLTDQASAFAPFTQVARKDNAK